MQLGVYSKCKVRITCADPEGFITRMSETEIEVMEIQYVQPLQLELWISFRDYQRLKMLCNHIGADIKLLRVAGLKRFIEKLRNRAVLLLTIMTLCILTVFLPTRVLFVTVDGNSTVHETRILEAAQLCGISFGASRSSVRSEKVKNALLQHVPQLKWVGVNTYGCCAVISVKERQENLRLTDPNNAVCGIYAVRDGIVQSITVTKGTQLCSPGQAVKKGQLLVSGYTDCGLLTKAERAEAEIIALTQRKIYAKLPVPEFAKGDLVKKKTYWTLQLGKKQINFYNHSGNYDALCGKIYKTMHLTLPGGFRLPVSIVRETVYEYQASQKPPETDISLSDLASRYVTGVMAAGRILKKTDSVSCEDGCYILEGIYTCAEQIGKLENEEIR